VPNPASDYITISGYVPAKIKLYNTVGQLMVDTVNATHISVAQLIPGNYYINLYDANNTLVYQQQITKN